MSTQLLQNENATTVLTHKQPNPPSPFSLFTCQSSTYHVTPPSHWLPSLLLVLQSTPFTQTLRLLFLLRHLKIKFLLVFLRPITAWSTYTQPHKPFSSKEGVLWLNESTNKMGCLQSKTANVQSPDKEPSQPDSKPDLGTLFLLSLNVCACACCLLFRMDLLGTWDFFLVINGVTSFKCYETYFASIIRLHSNWGNFRVACLLYYDKTPVWLL